MSIHSIDSWYVIIFIVGASIGGLIAWLWSKSKYQQEREILKIKIAELETNIQNARIIQNWVDNSKDNLREAFSALASQALQNNNDQFLQLASQQMDNTLNQVRGDWNTQKVEIEKIINPLDKNLDKLDEKIQNLEQKREGAYKSLEEQLRQLATTHQTLQNSTTTLSQALKSSSVLGRWGEIQLRRIVELSGMLHQVDFQEQVIGNNLRPDMIIRMPNNGILPVDSKATLKFYLEAVSCDNEDTRNTNLDSHAKSIQNHIRVLSQRKYWDQFTKSPDFVVMFVPSEAGLYAAFERNSGLLNEAIEKRVLIASPMTLLALLKAIAYGVK